MYTTWAGETVSCFQYKRQSCNTIYIQFVGRLQAPTQPRDKVRVIFLERRRISRTQHERLAKTVTLLPIHKPPAQLSTVQKTTMNSN